MTSRDLNSINEAFTKATGKVVAEETVESKEIITEVAESSGDPVAQQPKRRGMFDPDWRSRKGKHTKKATKAELRQRERERTPRSKKVKEDLGPDFGDEEDLGDPSRHSGDYLDDEPLEVGDIVEVEGEGSDFVILSIDGDWVSAAEVGDGIEVKKDAVVKTSSMTWGKKESVRIERKLVTLKEKKKSMKYANIMEDFENLLSSSSKGFSLKSRINEEDGTSFNQPKEDVGVKLNKNQRPADEVDSEKQESSTENVDDDVQEPKEADKADKPEEKNTKKEKKVVEDSINNCNKGNIMSEDKSIFDKLYEQVMSEDDDFGAELGLPGGDEISVGDDEFGDEGGEDITVTLTPDQADAIRAVADQLAPADDLDAELDDLGGEEEPEEGFRREGAESSETVAEGDETSSGKPTSDGAKTGVDPSKSGHHSELPADALGGKSTGTGDAKVTDDAPTTGKATTDGKTVGDKKHGKGPLKAKAKI